MIYENYDGIEYELAATRLDLRFVPDETEFEDEPKQVATELPMLGNYQPTVYAILHFVYRSTRFILNLENLENLGSRPFLQKVRENLE